MEIKLRGHKKQTDRAIELWLRIATDLNAGLDPVQVADKYINPNTGKKYTRQHIYWVIKQLKTRPIQAS